MKNLWEKLSGKKTNIGMLLLLLAQGLRMFLPDLVPETVPEFIEYAGMILGGVGLGHKGEKAIQTKLSKK